MLGAIFCIRPTFSGNGGEALLVGQQKNGGFLSILRGVQLNSMQLLLFKDESIN